MTDNNSFKPKLSCLIPSRSQALEHLLLLQSPLFCCCCSASLVSLSTVKQWPGTVLPPCGKTDYCKITSVRMCDLRVQSTVQCEYSTRVLFWWRNSRHTHCMLSLAYTYKNKVYLGLYSSACLQGKNMGRFSHWSEQKQPNTMFLQYRRLQCHLANSIPTEETSFKHQTNRCKYFCGTCNIFW